MDKSVSGRKIKCCYIGLIVCLFFTSLTGAVSYTNGSYEQNRDGQENDISEDVLITTDSGMLTMNSAEVGITITILFLIMFISLTGNILVVLSYMISKRLRGYAHLLILNLAVSDLCITCLSLPLRICQLFGFDWSDGFTSCSVNVAFTIFFFTASNINLFLVTLDRYLGVIHPVKYRAKGSRKKVKYAIGTAWVLSFAIGFLPLTGLGQGKPRSNSADFICTFGTVLHGGYVSFVTICTLLIPWIVMICMYARVLRVGLSSVQTGIRSNARLREEGQPIPDKVQKRQQRNIKKRANELRLARAVFLVLTLYTICMVPIGVLDLIQILSGYAFPEIVIKIALMLAYFNPAVNPPIYAASIEHYRNAFLRLLICRKWLRSLRGKLKVQRATSYKNTYASNKASPVVDNELPWRQNLTVPGTDASKMNSSMIQSTTSEFDGSFDDLSYEDTTAVGGGLSTSGKLNPNSLHGALYTSTTTLISIVFSQEEIEQFIFDLDTTRSEKPLSESVL